MCGIVVAACGLQSDEATESLPCYVNESVTARSFHLTLNARIDRPQRHRHRRPAAQKRSGIRK